MAHGVNAQVRVLLWPCQAGGSITLAPNGMRVLQRLGLVDSLVDTQGDAAAEEATAAAAAAGLSAVQGSGVGVGSRSGTGWGAEPPAGEELKSITLANPDGSAIVTFPTRWVSVGQGTDGSRAGTMGCEGVCV